VEPSAGLEIVDKKAASSPAILSEAADFTDRASDKNTISVDISRAREFGTLRLKYLPAFSHRNSALRTMEGNSLCAALAWVGNTGNSEESRSCCLRKTGFMLHLFSYLENGC
jgi:hypothetical protein